MALKLKLGKGVQVRSGAQHDITAAAAVAAVGSAERNILLATKVRGAIAPAAGADVDDRFVKESSVGHERFTGQDGRSRRRQSPPARFCLTPGLAVGVPLHSGRSLGQTPDAHCVRWLWPPRRATPSSPAAGRCSGSRPAATRSRSARSPTGTRRATAFRRDSSPRHGARRRKARPNRLVPSCSGWTTRISQ